MHLVHRNAKYHHLEQAMSKSDGLAVIAILFEMDPYEGHDQWMHGFNTFKALDSVNLSSLY